MTTHKTPPVKPPAEEKDQGYGQSHGYGPGHGGPSGPGDVPAKDDPESAKHDPKSAPTRGASRAKPPTDPDDELTRPSEHGPWES